MHHVSTNAKNVLKTGEITVAHENLLDIIHKTKLQINILKYTKGFKLNEVTTEVFKI